MKKLYWIFLVILLFFAGDRVAGFVLKQLTERSQFRYSRMYQGHAAADILLVGNSRGLIFYQPYIEKITGGKTFNLSYNGMPMDLGRTLVADYLEKYPAPKQMIVDVSMCDRQNAELISSFNLFTPYSEGMYDLINKNDKNSAIAGKLSHLYLYNSEIFQRSLFYLNKSDEDWLLDRVINQAMVDGISEYKADSITIIPAIFQELKETIQLANSKGVDVQLVINPYYPPFVAKLLNLDELKNRVEAATGMTVKDYSTAVKEVNGFGDYQHLNKTGAREFLEVLMKDGVLRKIK